MGLKNIIKKIIYREKYDSETYIKYLRKKGTIIGENCTIYSPIKTKIDEQNPYMITIGNNVKITEGVVILTHDFSWSVSSNIDGYITGSVGFVTIGDNVFIGMNAIILRNVNIGNNVIIGAGSVVTKNCESNFVYAGNPARKIMSVEEYHKRRILSQESDVSEIIKKYYIINKKYPTEEVLREYMFLFKERKKLDNITQKLMQDSGHYEKCKKKFIETSPKYNGVDEMINKITKQEKV